MIPSTPTTRKPEPIAIVHFPSRGASRADTADAIAVPMLHGIIVSPARSALNPNPTWSMRLKVKKNAGMPAMKTAEIRTPMRNAGMRNSDSRTRGNRSDGNARS